MKKYDKAIETLQQKQKNIEEQEKLHKKYKEEKPEVVIKEKSNTIKFLIKTLGHLLRIIAICLILALATIGALTLIYSHLRQEFLLIVQEIIAQIL